MAAALNREKTNAVLARTALVATTMIWGVSFVILKNTLSSVPVLYLLALRFSVSTALMALVSVRRLRQIDRRYLRAGALLGLAIFVANLTQTYGLAYTTPGKNAFLTTTYCVLTPFLMWILYKVKLRAQSVAAALICIVGIGFVSLDGHFSIGLGDLLTICSSLFYALQIALTDRVAKRMDIPLLIAVQSAVTALLSWAAALLTGQPIAALSLSSWGAIAYLGVLCNCVCFGLQIFGQRHTAASTAAILLTLEGVFGVLVSVIFYHERLTGRLIVGFVLIFAAVLLSELKLKSPRRGKTGGGDREDGPRA